MNVRSFPFPANTHFKLQPAVGHWEGSPFLYQKCLFFFSICKSFRTVLRVKRTWGILKPRLPSLSRRQPPERQAWQRPNALIVLVGQRELAEIETCSSPNTRNPLRGKASWCLRNKAPPWVFKRLNLHRSKPYCSLISFLSCFPFSFQKHMLFLTWVKVRISEHTLGIRLFWRFRVLSPGSFSNVEGILVIFFPFKVTILVFSPPFNALINNRSAMGWKEK